MNENKELIEKIDKFLNKDGKKSKSMSMESIVPIKKLMGCDWGTERHLREMALGSFAELAECDDEAASEFMKQLYGQAKVIGEAIIKMYMTSNDMDLLPPRG